jgi:threonine dehydrogenase-like Zn-dependent dehydrogenase
LIAAIAARLPGAEVQLIDIDPSRAALASAFGCGFALPSRARGDADLVFHASGNPEGLATAFTIAGFEATVVEMSWYGTRKAPLELGGAFHSHRLTLRSSQVGAVPATRRGRWSRQRRLTLALSLLRDPLFDLLLSDETDFTALPELMARLALSSEGALCHTVRYS